MAVFNHAKFYAECHYAGCYFAESHYGFLCSVLVIVLGVRMPSVVMLNVTIANIVKQCSRYNAVCHNARCCYAERC